MKTEWTETLRDKLAEHTIAPPEELWTSINAALDKQESTRRAATKTKTVRRMLYAACALLVIGLGLHLYNAPEPAPLLATTTQEAPKASPEAPQQEPPQAPIPPKTENPKSKTENRNPKIESREPAAENRKSATENRKRETGNPKTATETQEPAPTPQEKNTKTAIPTTPSPKQTIRIPNTPKHKTASVTLYAANITQASNLGNSSPDNPSSGGIIQGGESNNFTSSVAVTTTKAKHRQPLRLGASLSYPIDERLSLNAGLTLTRLSSEITTTITYGGLNISTTERQNCTYIGVPVGATYRILDMKPASLYLTAGGMVEHCVSGDESTPQLSVFGGAGLQLEVSPTVSIYAEPLVTHYIDNHSHLINIYKDKPTNLDIRFGLRLSLGQPKR